MYPRLQQSASPTAITARRSMSRRRKKPYPKLIASFSGKGGVGNMTSAMSLSRCAALAKAGVLDADITGPSIPRLFGVKGPATGDGESINPVSAVPAWKI